MTSLELNVLSAFNINYLNAEDEIEDNVTYTTLADIQESIGLSIPTIKGACGSLVKKGYISPYENMLVMEDKGIIAYFDNNQ